MTPLRIALLSLLSLLLAPAAPREAASVRSVYLPYAEAGLDERQAAAHLLSRFTYGPTPGQIDEVVEMGLANWFSRQLASDGSSSELDRKLGRLRSIGLSNEDILRLYPQPGRVRREAVDEGVIDADTDPREQRRELRAFYDKKGYRPQRQLVAELIAQRVLRAAGSPNQIQEVMVDFWFNHFYVSATDNQCRRFIGTYERDVIRPNVFTSFGQMLVAVAEHPAMLLYLDNAQSSASEGAVTTAAIRKMGLSNRDGAEGERYAYIFEQMEEQQKKRREEMEKQIPAEFRPRRGVNENYARELLELHTLGVDGGYTQKDVEEVARAFTGWTVLPDVERRGKMRERLARNEDLSHRLGFVIEGDFLFNARWHDAGEKTILGRTFPPGGGIEEGEDVLDMLAIHPSTAQHIARKLAVRFVGDEPPQSIVDRLARVFEATGGDLTALLWEIVGSPEFWREDARRSKIKSPFELAVSSVRGLGADVGNPRQLVEWIDKMGQPLYRYQAPTGFPDNAEMWVNAGSLLHRMNFGMTLAAGRVKGVPVDLDAIRQGREPESAEAALAAYAKMLLPGRDVEETIRVLRPMVTNPDVADQIRERSQAIDDGTDEDTMTMQDDLALEPFGDDDPAGDDTQEPKVPMSLAQVVGLILGSPEFQRR